MLQRLVQVLRKRLQYLVLVLQLHIPALKYARLTLTSDQNLGSSSGTTTITNFNTRAVDSSDSNALTSTLGDGKFVLQLEYLK